MKEDETMETITLNNGVVMPMLGFGTLDVRNKATVLQALEQGYRLIDTAQMYDNESIVGAALRESGLARTEVFITTKLYRDCQSRAAAQAGIERSLNTLQSDWIDLLLIHEPYPAALEMYEALKDALRAGKVRAIGISNFNASRYDDFCTHCDIIPALNQVESHIYYPQRSLATHLHKGGTQMQAWGPFTEGRRNIFAEPLLNEIGHQYGKTAAQVALRYLLQCGIAVVVKSAHPTRMAENLDVFDFHLTAPEMARLATLDEKRSLFGWYDHPRRFEE